MKKIAYIILAALVSSLWAACKKDTLITYNAQDEIYFNYKEAGLNIDSTTVTFAYSGVSVKDSTFKIPLAVTGVAKDHDRTYIVTVDKSSTAISGQHYTLPSTFILRANRLIDSLPVKLLRSSDLQSQTVRVTLNLQESADLKTDMKTINAVSAISFKLNLNDILGPGQYWNSMTSYFGTFSVKKIRLINQVAGMPLNYYISTWLRDTQSSAKLALYAITTARYLSDQKALGNTVYEDDGVTPMTMGVAYQ